MSQLLHTRRRPQARALTRWCAGGALALGLALPLAARAAIPGGDPLTQAAPHSERALASVLLGVTRAGDRLVAVGERGVILLSDNQGRQWRQASVPVSVTLTAVSFATPQLGWAVGHAGVVLHTEDGGQHWQRQLEGAQAAQLELTSAQAAAQAGGDEAATRRLRDAQRMVSEGADKPWLDVHFWSPREGLVVGAYGNILRTQDGGRSWESLRGHMSNPRGRHLYAIQDSGDALYLAGEQGQLFRSRDHGGHFETLATPYAGTLFGVQARAGGELLVFGLRGNALRSSDDGLSWEKVEAGQPTTLTAATRRADGRLLLVDEAGRVLLQNGATLQPLRVPQPSSFTGIVAAADGSLVLTGVRGITRIAADGGSAPSPSAP